MTLTAGTLARYLRAGYLGGVDECGRRVRASRTTTPAARSTTLQDTANHPAVSRTLLPPNPPAGPEDLFVEGGDDPVPGELPPVWGMERVMQIAHLVERTGLTVMPED